MKINTKYIYNHYPLLRQSSSYSLFNKGIFCFYRANPSYKYLIFKMPLEHEPTFSIKSINNFEFLYTKYDRNIVKEFENTKNLLYLRINNMRNSFTIIFKLPTIDFSFPIKINQKYIYVYNKTCIQLNYKHSWFDVEDNLGNKIRYYICG